MCLSAPRFPEPHEAGRKICYRWLLRTKHDDMWETPYQHCFLHRRQQLNAEDMAATPEQYTHSFAYMPGYHVFTSVKEAVDRRPCHGGRTRKQLWAVEVDDIVLVNYNFSEATTSGYTMLYEAVNIRRPPGSLPPSQRPYWGSV
jgi:hypothetical protein